MSDLKNEFQGFIGLTVKNPDRLSCDIDLTADKIGGAAARNGLMLIFQKASTPAGTALAKTVTAHITPENLSGSRWRITEFTFS
jgi:hypothetical protein